MRVKYSRFLITASAILAILVAGCSSTGAGTSTTPKTTTATPSTAASTVTAPKTTAGTPTTTTTTTTTSSSSGSILQVAAIDITTHSAAVMASYKGLCQMCHASGLSNSNPYPPTWDGAKSGSLVNKGVYPITPGTPADHTPYTVDECTKAGCHAVPGSTPPPPATTSAAPSTTAAVTSTTTEAAIVYTKAPKVVFDGGTFEPSKVTIAKGLSILFENPEHSDYTVICIDSTGKKIFTEILEPESKDVECPSFTVAGVYTIYDQANAKTTMTVTVV